MGNKNDNNQIEFAGTLRKWTNFLYGWQDRYILLKNGILSYYLSEHERDLGCRGALSLANLVIKPCEFDECRFDIKVNDCVIWYLRADSVETKESWFKAVEAWKIKSSGYRIQSIKVPEKLIEFEMYKYIIMQQIDNLQKYVDFSNNNNNNDGLVTKKKATKKKASKIPSPSSSSSVIADTLSRYADILSNFFNFVSARLVRGNNKMRVTKRIKEE